MPRTNPSPETTGDHTDSSREALLPPSSPHSADFTGGPSAPTLSGPRMEANGGFAGGQFEVKSKAEREAELVDFSIEGDGINDKSHEEANFLRKVGSGTPSIEPYRKGLKVWPPLPAEVKQTIDRKFFRAPDLNTSSVRRDGEASFEESFLKRADELGWQESSGCFSQMAAYLCAPLLCLSVVGTCWLHSSIRRVNPGEVGFCTDSDRNVHLLERGWHYRPSPWAGKIKKLNMSDDDIHFLDQAHIIRVQPGEYVAVKLNDQVTLLEPDGSNVGVHMFDDPTMEVVRVQTQTKKQAEAKYRAEDERVHIRNKPGKLGVDIRSARIKQNAQRIMVGPVNIITVRPGEVAKVRIDNKPYVLFEGTHTIESDRLQFIGFTKDSDTFSHDVIHHYFLPPGKIGAVRVGKQAVFLKTPGSYWFYTSHFDGSPLYSPSQPKIVFNPITRVLLNSLTVGMIANQQGEILRVDGGEHFIELPNIFLASIPMQSFPIKADMEAITADHLDVKFSISLNFRVSNARLAYTAFKGWGEKGTIERKRPDGSTYMESVDDLGWAALHETALQAVKGTMTEIVRQMHFQKTLINVPSSVETISVSRDEDPGAAIRKEWSENSGEYKTRVAASLKKTYGIELDIDQWNVHNFDLARESEQKKLTSAAYAKADAANQKIKSELKKELAEIRRDEVRIETETQTLQAMLQAQSKNDISLLEAKREAEQLQIASQAKADAVGIAASAEADRIRKIAQAEKEARELFPAGVELRRSQQAADALRDSKVIVCGSDSNNPFAGMLTAFTGMLSSSLLGAGDNGADQKVAAEAARLSPNRPNT